MKMKFDDYNKFNVLFILVAVCLISFVPHKFSGSPARSSYPLPLHHPFS